MKIIIILLFTSFFFIPAGSLFGQQFNLEWQSDGIICYIGDLDADGVGELLINMNDTVNIYDGSSHVLKWSISDKGEPHVFIPRRIPQMDFNSDGIFDIIFLDGGTIRIIDITNGSNIFEYTDPAANFIQFLTIEDIDGDLELEMIFRTGYTEKSYIFSTGVSANSVGESQTYQNIHYELYQNNPNPFSKNTSINYEVQKEGLISLKIYNLSGQEVRVLVDDFRQNGSYSVVWDGKDDFGHNVSSGIYYYQMLTDDFTTRRKMILLE